MTGSANLRPEQPGDEPFLYQLFAQARSAIIASLPLGHITAETLLRQQFELQTFHFRSYYPSAEYCIIEQEDTPVGRLVVDYSGQAIRMIDVALLQEYRNRGIGSCLLHDLLAEARSTGQVVRLHVERGNPALRLYHRFGFRQIQDREVYLEMEWGTDGQNSEALFIGNH